MYGLNTIRKINAERCARPSPESETTRHCSHAVSTRQVGNREIRQVVLHSARQRSTALIEGATAARFLVEYQSTNSLTSQDAIIEKYFSGVPTGKQALV